MTSYDANERAAGTLPTAKFGSALLWVLTFGFAFVVLVALLISVGPPEPPEGVFPP
jgi:hypothetical protein